jgi:gluconokinase
MVVLQHVFNMIPRLKIVMGVCGSGKSTIAKQLAHELGGGYLDGDDYHPSNNIDTMRQGKPLTDNDRWPWLQRFAEAMAGQSGITIGACSALTKAYRELLSNAAGEPILFIHLAGSKALISRRLESRKNHFMPVSQLDNQLNILETPGPEEIAVSIDISGSKEQIIAHILAKLITLKSGVL